MKIDSENTLKFLASTSRRELSNSLDIKYSVLAFNLFVKKILVKYREFDIKKRNGGVRHIIAPNDFLKKLQQRLALILLDIYPPKNCVHGYLQNKNIKSNATVHVNKRILINLDLENFFPSINFGRVLGIFKSHPFNFNKEVAITLAQICCYNSILPQGAPTSPIVSNFVCRRLDNAFLDLASEYKFNYSRYADDISISTNLLPLPKKIGTICNNELRLSEEILNIIKQNGFGLNVEKVRYAYKNNRQEVTGLITNSRFINVKRRYIRHIRASLHAWEKFGIEKASTEHFEKYNYKFENPSIKELAFQNQLIGKIGFVGDIRGKENKIYIHLSKRLNNLSPQVYLSVIQRVADESEIPIIFGEGKTDWKHLKAALSFFQASGMFKDLIVKFEEYLDGFDIGNNELLKITTSISKTHFINQNLFPFLIEMI